MSSITPEDSIVAEIVVLLDEGQLEDFEERAGILEFNGGIGRTHAEALALLEVLRRHGLIQFSH